MNSKHIGFNRAYVKGLNEVHGTSLHALNGIRNSLNGVFDKLSTNELEAIALHIGQLERFHAPHEIPTRTNSDGWVGSACAKTDGTWEQWIQVVAVPDSSIPVHAMEHERIHAQTVMAGSDRTRIHIEWNSGRQEGYIHSATSRYMTASEFMETTAQPPNCLMGLYNCPGSRALHGWLIQTGSLLENVDESFLWYDSERTMKWYRFLVYVLGNETFVCVVDEHHLKAALSGFDEHQVTICESSKAVDDHGFYLVKGSIRIDGSYNGKQRTAVIMTSRLEESVIDKVVG